MKAEEAIEISMANQMPIEEVFESIEATAKNGCTSIGIFNMSEENMVELIKLGYSIRTHTDLINGDKSVIINWEK